MAGAFLAILLPAGCLLCGGRSGNGLCPDCHARFFGGGRVRCCICANPLAAAEVASDGCCGRCRRQRPAYDATVTAADYALPVDRLVLQLKFGARLAHARLFGQLLAAAWQASSQPSLPQLLCPVPLGPRRLAERGFNQALEIARPLGRALGVPVRARLAQRQQDTPPQSSLDWGQRTANVARAFTLDSEAALYGRHVGLVDDVMSSGATLQALALACKQAGAARVSNLVFARTPPEADPY